MVATPTGDFDDSFEQLFFSRAWRRERIASRNAGEFIWLSAAPCSTSCQPGVTPISDAADQQSEVAC